MAETEMQACVELLAKLVKTNEDIRSWCYAIGKDSNKLLTILGLIATMLAVHIVHHW